MKRRDFVIAVLVASIIFLTFLILQNNISQTVNINISRDYIGSEQQQDLVNLNTATKEELMELDGIGETLTQRIIDYRNQKHFESITELKNVKGIGEKTYKKIKGRVTI